MQAELVLKEAENLAGVTTAYPFDDSTLVFKVGGKIFAIVDANEFKSINLKCAPEKAIELREQFESVKPGYHMNKQHWNTIDFESDMQTDQLIDCLHHSYALVVNKLPKRLQSTLPPVAEWLSLSF